MNAPYDIARHIETAWSIDPSSPALEFEGRWITWGELRDASRAMDDQLTHAGIGQGARVGVLLRNRPGLIAALLMLLASRRCMVSISPFQSADTLHRDLRTLNLAAIIADAKDFDSQATTNAVAESGALGLSLEAGAVAPARVIAAANPSHVPVDAADVALEILTSGTTGAPKRIAISIRTIDDAIADGVSSAGVGGPEPLSIKKTPTVLAAPIMHVSGLFGALVAICEARPVVLLEKFSVEGWVDAVSRHRIKFASLPPTPMRMVLDAAVPAERLSSLVAVRAGTAPLPPETQREFQSRYGIPVLVQYGATEWMGGIAGWTLRDHRTYGVTKLGSVGRVRGDVKLRIVDPASGLECVSGAVGVLEVLPTQRLGTTDWTRTTDLASLDTDGFLYIHGRVDDTIIRGGFKVQLNHVADILMQHESVLEASVVGVPDARLGQVPVAAVQLRPGMPVIDEGELAAYARQHLTPYQVPVRLKVVAALPRTISMKVSRPAVIALFS